MQQNRQFPRRRYHRSLFPILAATLSQFQPPAPQIAVPSERTQNVVRSLYQQRSQIQVKGVGTLIALTFLLTLEDPHRFRKSRDVGCYVGLQPGRRNSGQSEPQMHISKEGRSRPIVSFG